MRKCRIASESVGLMKKGIVIDEKLITKREKQWSKSQHRVDSFKAVFTCFADHDEMLDL